MNLWIKLQSRFHALFQKRRLDLEMDEELRSHLELRTRSNIEAGMNPEEARFAALRQFGHSDGIKETCRDQRGVRWLENLLQDFRFGARQLRKNPGFTAIAVLTLALGIGANTAIFTVFNALLLRSLPVEKPNELAQVAVVGTSGNPSYTFSYPLYERLRDDGSKFLDLFAAGGVGLKHRLIIPAGENSQTEFVRAQAVSGNFFSTLGVPAILGRTFVKEDDQPGNPKAVAVISHGFWQRQFGGDISIVGKKVTFDDIPFTIIGVTPPDFFGFQPGENPELWWPLQMAARINANPSLDWFSTGVSWLTLMGRLVPEIARPQAEAGLAVVYQNYRDEFVASRIKKWSAEMRARELATNLRLEPGHAGRTDLRDKFRLPIVILMAVVAVVLLIACANVASLLLARAAARQREFSIRNALGARRFRLVSQLLTESLLLAGLGGALGLLFAIGGTRLLQTVMRLHADSVSLRFNPDLRVLFFTTVVAMITGLLFGLVPALHSSRPNLATTLKETAGSVSGMAARQWSLQCLVIAQVALALVLLAGAGLFIRSLQQLKGQDAGFNQEKVVLFNIDFTERPNAARWGAFRTELLTRLEALPGVHSVSLFNMGYLSGNWWTEDVLADGLDAHPGESLECVGTLVGANFFDTMGTPILAGRDFGLQDEQRVGETNRTSPHVIVVNQALARRYFGPSNPVGRKIFFAHRPEEKFVIVGLVPDSKYRSMRESAPPGFYMPFGNERVDSEAFFAVRISGDSRAAMGRIPGLAQAVDRNVRVRDLHTMEELVNASVYQERVIAQLGGFFSMFALLLACLGLYGVLSFSVAQRTREIGVRVALGAQQRDVLALVISKGMRLVLVGGLIGLAGGLAITRIISKLLFGVGPADPLTFASVVGILGFVAVLASWLPARRAATVNPIEALRSE